jgi:hypothetical protein
MLIRIITTPAAVPPTGEAIAAVHGAIQPQVTALDGNRGFVLVLDRASARYTGVAAWTDQASLEASGGRFPDLMADLLRRLHGGALSVEVFDLVLAHVVKPLRVGHWGRMTRLEVPRPDLARAEREARQLALALFERYAGLTAIVLCVDRAAAVLQSIAWFDGLHVLRESAERSRELRELLVAAVAGARVVEDHEVEAVIVELPAPAPGGDR